MPLLLLLTKALPSMPGRPVDSLSHTHTSTYSLSLSLSHTHTHTHTNTHDMHTNAVCRGVGVQKQKLQVAQRSGRVDG